MCFIVEHSHQVDETDDELTEPCPAETSASSKSVRVTSTTLKKKRGRPRKNPEKPRTAGSAREKKLDLSSKFRKKGRPESRLAENSVSENGPAESATLVMRSPPITAPLRTVSPPPAAVLPPKKKNAKNKPYLCAECGRELKSKSALDLHLRVHTDSRPFTCLTCGRSFRANGGLTRHQVLLV